MIIALEFKNVINLNIVYHRNRCIKQAKLSRRNDSEDSDARHIIDAFVMESMNKVRDCRDETWRCSESTGY